MCVCVCSPCGRMCVWVCGSGCITSDGSHRRGTGRCVGGMCHRHNSRVVSAVEALDFRAARLNLSALVVVWRRGAVWVCGEHAVTQRVNTAHRAGVMLHVSNCCLLLCASLPVSCAWSWTDLRPNVTKCCSGTTHSGSSHR